MVFHSVRPLAAAGLAAALSALTISPAYGCDLVIEGGRLYASPASPALDDSLIIVSSGRIEAVGPRNTLKPPQGCTRIDASGQVVVAGFWNSHAHLTTPLLLRQPLAPDADLSREFREKFLRWGFTTIFDLASTTKGAIAIRNRIRSGKVTGPRILTVGDPFYPAGGTPIYARPIYAQYGLPSAEVLNAESGAARVRRQAAAGTDGVKLFTGAIVGGKRGVLPMDAGVAKALVRQAHALHLPVFAHPSDAAGVAVALTAGVDVLAHAAPLMGPWTPRFARVVASKHVALIPTLDLFAIQPDPRTPVSVAQEQVRVFKAVGGDVLFGTDAGFTEDFDTGGELRLLGQTMDWRGVFAALTTAPARRFSRSISGKLARNQPADIVILAGDPSKDVTAFARVAKVIHDGRIVYELPPN